MGENVNFFLKLFTRISSFIMIVSNISQHHNRLTPKQDHFQVQAVCIFGGSLILGATRTDASESSGTVRVSVLPQPNLPENCVL